jgi:hypothetical protein
LLPPTTVVARLLAGLFVLLALGVGRLALLLGLVGLVVVPFARMPFETVAFEVVPLKAVSLKAAFAEPAFVGLLPLIAHDSSSARE